MPTNLKTQQWPQDWYRSIFPPIPKKGNAKECSNYHTITLISHASKVMLKILQARLQGYMDCELPDAKAGFRKGRGTRDQIANICWIMEKAREFQKYISVQFSRSSCLTLCDPMDLACQASINNSQNLFKLKSFESVMPSKHLILCCFLLLPPSIFPSISVLSNESLLHIRWPKYWNFSFSMSPSNE